MMVPKIVTFDVALKSTERQWVQKIAEVYTNDLNSVSLQFRITDCTDTELTGSTAIVLLKMRDGSFFQEPSVDVTRTLNVFSYTLKENEGNHDGLAEIQLIVTIGAKEFATQKYNFKVISGLDSEVAREIMIYDWSTLTAEARAYIDEFAALTEDLTATLAAADVNIGEFDVALENGIVAANLAEKLEDFESTNNSRLLSVESGLADKADQSFVDSQFATIVSGTPKGTYTDLPALQNAYPSGAEGIFLILANGHWYYWNGTSSAWMDGGVYQSTQIAEEGILLKNLSDTMLDKIHNLKEYNRVSMALSDFATTNTTALSLDGAYIKGISSGEKVVIKQYKNWGIAANDKILVRLKIKANKTGNIIIYLTNTDSGGVSSSTTQSISTTERMINLVMTGASICNGIFFSCTDFVTSGDFVEIDDIVVVALTPIFGTGSEPTDFVARAYLWASDNKYTDAYDLLMADTIKGTTVYTVKGTGVYTITHKALLSEATLTIRTDVITIVGSMVTETRTTFTGDVVTLTTNTSTLTTEVA